MTETSDLRRRIYDAARRPPIRLSESTLALAVDGGAFHLNSAEAGDIAEAVWLAVQPVLAERDEARAEVEALAEELAAYRRAPHPDDAYMHGRADARKEADDEWRPVIAERDTLRERIAADCARRAGYYDHPEIWLPESQDPDAIAARAMQQAWATAARLIRSGEIPAELVQAATSDIDDGED